jgi:diguanylate cyclase (GGDEF)-like protein
MIQRQRIRRHGMQLLAWLRVGGIVFGGIALVAVSSVSAPAAPKTITSLAELHSLTNQQASKSIPVVLEATVTNHVKGTSGIFLQDGALAIYADAPERFIPEPGDQVQIRGKTGAGFRPYLVAESVTVIGHRAMPAPVPASYRQLVRDDFDCMRVTVRGRVKSADLVTYGNTSSIFLELSLQGGGVNAIINSTDRDILRKLPGAEVEVAGSASAIFDGKRQLTGAILKVPTLSDVKMLEAAPIRTNALPFTPMNEIPEHSYIQDLSERVKVGGTITYYVPGAAVVLQSGSKSLWIETKNQEPLHIGDLATAFGYPTVRNGVLTLTSAEVEDSHQRLPIAPQPIRSEELYSGANAFNLISIEGQVVKEGREKYQDKYLLTAGGNLITVAYRHIDENLGFEMPPMKQIPVGATVRVTGVPSVSYGSNPFEGPSYCDILLRSFDDIQVVAKASWLNVQNLIGLVAILLAVIFIAGIRVIWSEHQAHILSATLASTERRRGKILEDINNTRPLAEILEDIKVLVSARLGGALCWIQVKDGATLGKLLPETSQAGLRIIEEPIHSRSGPALGSVYAAFAPHAKFDAVETASLEQAAGLARLAIETSQLYSDLVRRSEFDLLTNIQNRFSFEKQIEAAIDSARRSAGIFGLLYIDLNDFKQINDQFGHHAGDLYLQEVASRMKNQMRPGDIPARLGGDEFTVILPNVRGRADVEEITLRLERGFKQPFTLEGRTVRGTASIGVAIYPTDGTTRDSLLNAADAAMYVAKQTKLQRELPLPALPQPARLYAS